MAGIQTITLEHVEMSVAYQLMLTALTQLKIGENADERRYAEAAQVVEKIQHQMEANFNPHEAQAAWERHMRGVAFMTTIPAFGDKEKEDLA